ncbi:signal peptidase I [Candidatus Woesearchaeota archaeon]|nr:signal peptidase I [Candidatus Woesearchaeota archaeon]
MEKLKYYWKRFWHFIWEDDSIWSWLANVALAIILIKFIIYPAIGFALSTNYPIVAVVSRSMEHQGNFDKWWNKPAICKQQCTQEEFYKQNEYNITKEEFQTFRYTNGFNKGDIMVLKGVAPDKVAVGDVIVFTSIMPDPIIHRVIALHEKNSRYSYTTKGDYNPAIKKDIFEDDIDQSRLIGKAVVRLPYFGWLKITAFCSYMNIVGKDGFVECMSR